MFEFVVTLPIWKALSETEYKIFLNPQNSDMTEKLRYDWKQRKMKIKTFLRAKPGHGKVLALQKPDKLIPDKFTKGHQISWNLN